VQPQVWIAPVNAVIPGTGQYVWWNAVWMEKAQGVSLHQLAMASHPSLVSCSISLSQCFTEPRLVACTCSTPWYPPLRLPYNVHWQMRVNRTQVLRSAVFDLLIGQRDRHAKVSADGINVVHILTSKALASLNLLAVILAAERFLVRSRQSQANRQYIGKVWARQASTCYYCRPTIDAHK
jgi:hypothetical protein